MIAEHRGAACSQNDRLSSHANKERKGCKPLRTFEQWRIRVIDDRATSKPEGYCWCMTAPNRPPSKIDGSR